MELKKALDTRLTPAVSFPPPLLLLLLQQAKQIVPTPFKPSTPSNRPEGKGAYFGTFGKWQNMKDTDHYDKKTGKVFPWVEG